MVNMELAVRREMNEVRLLHRQLERIVISYLVPRDIVVALQCWEHPAHYAIWINADDWDERWGATHVLRYFGVPVTHGWLPRASDRE